MQKTLLLCFIHGFKVSSYYILIDPDFQLTPPTGR